MTQEEKQKFINELIDSVRSKIIQKIPMMPLEWDGHELRSFIADKFAYETTLDKFKHLKKCYKDYKTEVIARNL